MTIQNKTARELLYSWHGEMSSAFYAAASSGLCMSFRALAHECVSIDEPDRARLMSWIAKKQKQCKTTVHVQGVNYFVLPWVSRTYFPKGSSVFVRGE